MALKNVTGKVKKCGAYPLKKAIPNPFDSDGPDFTHRLAIQMDDGNWYGFGNTDKEEFYVKNAETGNWEILGDGSEVLIQYTLSDCGKYRNAKKSNLTVLNLEPGQPFNKGGSKGGNSGGSSYDLTGVKVGHAINAAMLLLNNKPKNPSELVNTAKQLHDISSKVEEDYKAANPSMSLKDTGSASGHAVLNACKLTNDIEEVEKKSKNLLTKVVPVITAYVRGESKQEEKEEGQEQAEQKEEKPAPKKETPTKKKSPPKPQNKKPAPKPEPAPEEGREEGDAENFEGFDDMDDDNLDF